MNLFDLSAKITLDSAEYQRGLDEASNKTSSFADKLKNGVAAAANVAATAITAASTAAVAFAASAVKVGAQFDSSMSQVAATMGVTTDEIGELREFAKEMGATTAFSASQAADALNYMALAGYSAEESMKALPNVLNLAAAGGIDLAYASDMVTDAQSALGLSFDESAILVDQLAMTSSKANASVAQLGEAILTIGGTAKNLAGGTNELNTVLGILADNGIKGAEGGTALRNIILSLSAPTDTAAKSIQALGLEVFDAQGNMRTFKDIFGDLRDTLSTMTQAEQTQVLNQIFNKVDLQSVNALLATTGERFDELSNYIANASYSFDEINDALQNSGIAWEKYNDTAWKTVGGGINSLTDEIIYNIKEIGTSAEELQDYLIFEYDLDADDALIAIESVQQSLENAQGAAQRMAETQLDNLAGDVTKFKSALEGAQIVVSDVLTPSLREFVQFGTDGIGKLATAFQEGGLSGAMEALSTILSDALAMIIEQIPSMIDAGMQLLGALGQGLMDNMPLILDTAVQVIVMLAQGLANNLPELIPAAVEAIVTIGKALIDNIPLLLDAAWQIVVGIAEGLMNAFPELRVFWEKLSGGFSDAWSKIKEIWDKVSPYFEKLWQNIKKTFSLVADVLGTVFKKAWQAIKIVWDLVEPYFSNLWKQIKNIFSVVGEVLGEYFSLAWKNIMLVWDTVISYFSTIWQNIKLIFSVVGDVLSGDFRSAWEKIKQVFVNWGQFFSGLWDNVKQIFANVGDFFINVGRAIIDGIKQGLSNAWSSLTGWFSDGLGNLVGGVKDFLGIHSPSTVFASIGRNMALGLESGWDKSIDSINRDIMRDLDFTGDIGVSYNQTQGQGLFNGQSNGFSIVQNIYSQAKTAADLMEEAMWQAQMGALQGV